MNCNVSKANSSRVQPDFEWLMEAEETLVRLMSNILNTSQKGLGKAIVEKGVSGAVGATGASGVMGLIGAYGTASTGTAISALSGAAASSAKLYWLGSLIGGGATVAGPFLLGVISLAGAYCSLKWWRGKPRTPEALTTEEKMIIEASLSLVKAFREQIKFGIELSSNDAKKLQEIAWSPLMSRLQEYANEKVNKTINFRNSVGLRIRVLEMQELSERLSGIGR